MPRIENEKEIVSTMISLYCRKNHNTEGLCSECQELQDYALKRLDNCRYGEDKTFCSKCRTHCYKSDMRQRIKQVMRYSGPWMILYHPLVLIKHTFQK